MSRWLTVDTHPVDSSLRWHHFGQCADLPLLSSAFRMDGRAISAAQLRICRLLAMMMVNIVAGWKVNTRSDFASFSVLCANHLYNSMASCDGAHALAHRIAVALPETSVPLVRIKPDTPSLLEQSPTGISAPSRADARADPPDAAGRASREGPV